MVSVPAFVEINEISEKDISDLKQDTGSTTVIPYKDWGLKQKPCTVYEIPLEYCKYRLENGRIRTEVLSYEKLKGDLKVDEEKQTTQDLIHSFLSSSDRKKNEDLKKILKKEGQNDPAVITSDGFLINGNRRKLAFTELLKEIPDERFKKLKVVILPGTNNPERPTVTDIALLENRFQVNVTGKSEYSKMNKALTFYSHVKSGTDLKELLKDDPTFGDPNHKDFEKKVKKFEDEYFAPLELMNDYLNINDIKGDYEKTKNRWMSFEDLSQKVMSKLNSEKFLIDKQINKNEIGKIQAAGFNIIKIKNSTEVAPDNRYLIRELTKWISDKELKKEVLKIGEIEDVDDKIKDPDERDEEWQKKNAEKIINIVKKLQSISTKNKEQEDPLSRLTEALQKITHEDLDMNQIKGMKISDLDSAIQICNKIEAENKQLSAYFWALKKDDKTSIAGLLKKFNNK